LKGRTQRLQAELALTLALTPMLRRLALLHSASPSEPAQLAHTVAFLPLEALPRPQAAQQVASRFSTLSRLQLARPLRLWNFKCEFSRLTQEP
jgi:hypothetical protein